MGSNSLETVTMLRDQVLLDIIEREEVGPSGIILTATRDKQTQTAKVLAVGEGIYEDGVYIPTTVKVGDIVLISDRASPNVNLPEISRKKLLILREVEIFGIIKRGEG